jgi:hypothetical protein
MTARDIETRVANYFDYRRNLIVPNASWGVGLHECDLLILSQRNYATEVEIKISRSDLRADLKKSHGHNSVKIKNLWFAVPFELVPDAAELAPLRAGILGIRLARLNRGGWHIREKLGIRDISTRELGMSWGTSIPSTYIDGEVTIIRNPQPERGARAWTTQERLKLAEIGLLRYWTRKAS